MSSIRHVNELSGPESCLFLIPEVRFTVSVPGAGLASRGALLLVVLAARQNNKSPGAWPHQENTYICASRLIVWLRRPAGKSPF